MCIDTATVNVIKLFQLHYFHMKNCYYENLWESSAKIQVAEPLFPTIFSPISANRCETHKSDKSTPVSLH